MATHSPMKVGSMGSSKDGEGNNVPYIELIDYEPRTFRVKLNKASDEQLALLKKNQGKVAMIPTLEGSMNGAFWMSLRTGAIIPLAI